MYAQWFRSQEAHLSLGHQEGLNPGVVLLLADPIGDRGASALGNLANPRLNVPAIAGHG